MNRTHTTRLGFETFESRDVASVSPMRPVAIPDFGSLASPRPAVVATVETPSPSRSTTGRITGAVADPAEPAIVFVGGWGSSMYQYA